MGWSFGWDTLAQMRDHCRRCVTDSSEHELLAERSTNYGRNLWFAVREHGKDVAIYLFLLKSSEGEWGYKSMSEHAGPVETDCPLDLLDMCTETTAEHAVAWRARVREAAARRAGKFKDGDNVTVRNVHYLVVGRHKRHYLLKQVNAAGEAVGATYRFLPAYMRPFPGGTAQEP